jgi:hypothetical protein
MVNMNAELYMVLLENDLISYEEYVREIPAPDIPPEYATVALFMKNKGKASERILKEST